MRVNFWLFVVLVAIGKAGRYALIVMAAQSVL
jgi:membrane protein YqaA with SNARE-associated domain